LHRSTRRTSSSWAPTSLPHVPRRAALRLSIPPTDDGTLRHLLGPLLTDEREEALRTQGKLELPYTPDGGESFAVTLKLSRVRRGVRGDLPARARAKPVPRRPSRAVAPPPAPVSSPAEIAPVGTPLAPRLTRSCSGPPRCAPRTCTCSGGEAAALRIDGSLRTPGASRGRSTWDELFAGRLGEAERARSPGTLVDLALEHPRVASG